MERAQIVVAGTIITAVILSGIMLYSQRTPPSEVATRAANIASGAPVGVTGGTGTNRGVPADAAQAARERLAKSGFSEGHTTSSRGVGANALSETVRAGERAASARSAETLSVGGGAGGGPSGGTIRLARPPAELAADLPGVPVASGGLSRGPGVGGGAAIQRVGQAPEDKPPGSTDQTAPGKDGTDGKNDVLLSVPLNGSVDAQGAAQPIVEQNVKPNDQGNGVEFPENSVLEFPDASAIVKPDAGAMSLDVQPDWNGTDTGDNSFVQVRTPDMWQGQMMLFRNGSYLRFVWFDSNGQENGVGTDISDWVAGEPHSITATWGQALMSLYVDGQLAGQSTYSGNLAINPGTPLFLGSNPQNRVPGAASVLQNFKVYGRTLTPDEIAAQ